MIADLIHTLQSLKIGLKVVDGSLKINAPKGTLTPEIIDQIKEHKVELVALLSSSESIPKAEKKDTYALTSSQERLWTLSQFETGNIAYNIFNAFKFKGTLDIDKMSLAFIKIIERHESLRTVFKKDEKGVLGQYIVPMEAYSGRLQFLDLSDTTQDDIRAYCESIQMHVFDLQTGPLFIGSIIKVSENEHVLMFAIHHIIGDGWSMELLNKEFIVLYNGLSLGQEVTLPELPIQYKDYSEWQNTDDRKSLLEKSKRFWLDTFSGELQVLELPSNKIRPKLKTYNGSTIEHKFSEKFTSQLNTYAQQNGVTLFMVLMAGVNGLLSRYANVQDIILGTPVAGRRHSDLENQIGLYLNTLAIRTTFGEKVTFEKLLSIQKETLLNAYAHQEYPFDKLVDELELERDLSRSVLFDIMVVFQNQAQLQSLKSNSNLNGIEVESYKVNRNTSQLDLSFIFSESDALELSIEYNTDIYDEFFIEQLFTHYENLMHNAIDTPENLIALIDFISDKERELLLEEFNNTAINYSRNKTIVDLFEEQVEKSNDRTAIVFEDKKLTYNELNKQANQLARYLRETYAIKSDDLIGIKLERSEQMLIAILGILKSGAAYVPIDITYPQERIRYMQQDSNCKIILDIEELEHFRKIKANYDVNNPKNITKANNLAYVMYTSGTTGKPKGVMIENNSVMNLVDWFCKRFNISESTVSIQLTDLSFDPSVEDIFSTLISGGVYHVISKDVLLDIDRLREYIKSNGITILNHLPTFLDELLSDCPKMDSLKTVIAGGEILAEKIKLNLLNRGYTLYNNYGPTEITVDALSAKLTSSSVVTLGTPIANTKIYVLSQDLSLQPIGFVGKLFVSGPGVARGYLNNPKLTSKRFIDNPFIEGDRMYDTGDLAKWLPDGTIGFIGREDSQVKIRGHRIELEEIENIIVQFSKDIKQVLVTIIQTKKEKELAVYYLAKSAIAKSELRNFIQERLPSYMTPSYYIALDVIPLTPNGKVDMKALPAVSQKDLIRNEYVAPHSEVEKQLEVMWREVLGLEKISITDNFFELGGHSLKATKLLSLIHQTFNTKIDIEKIFTTPTIKFLALEIENSMWLKEIQAPSTAKKIII